jgi:chromosome condensin MukBEF MukE localization factor
VPTVGFTELVDEAFVAASHASNDGVKKGDVGGQIVEVKDESRCFLHRLVRRKTSQEVPRKPLFHYVRVSTNRLRR